MNTHALRNLLGDERLLSLAGRYDVKPGDPDTRNLADRLRRYAGKLSAERFVLPIAGIQGSGKSTLLNALAFDTPVLPIDADETTCVPVEIAWAAQLGQQATIHYVDGRTESIPCTEDALRSVVHNENNAGNVKQVSRVVLTSNREMFRHGLVLVDLPGVGSLTHANMETTQRYLREAVGVIFMLRTVPPLTRSESIFVSLQWTALRTALFVQNRWNDETDEEALAGRDHNVKVLRQIAEQARIPLDATPDVRLVDGYEALRAALNGDVRGTESSGARAFAAELEGFGNDWSARVAADVAAACEAELTRLAESVATRLGETKLDRKAHRDHMEREAQAFIRRLEGIDERAGQMRDDARVFRRSVRDHLRKWETEKRAELRNRMRTKMRAGIVDGPRLSSALNDEQKEASTEIFGLVQEDALALQDRLRSDLQNLDAWATDAPDLRFTVDREEALRFENLAGRAGAVAGTLGGVWAGVEAGAAIGGFFGGPVGLAIGAAVGAIFGGLAGQYAGNKGKDCVTYLRARAVEDEVFAAIDKYIDGTSVALNRIAAQFCEQLDTLLDQWRASQTHVFEEKREQSLSILNKSAEEKSKLAEVLESDRAMIGSLYTRLNEVRT
jgi:hypothetical protein